MDWLQLPCTAHKKPQDAQYTQYSIQLTAYSDEQRLKMKNENCKAVGRKSKE